MTIFRVPRLPSDTPAALASVLSNAFKQLYADLKAMTSRPGTVAIRTSSYTPAVGETVRVQPPTDGMAFVLPTPSPDNRAQDITAILENPQGDLRVTVSLGTNPQGVTPTVDGQTLATFSTAGTVRFVSNGVDKWSVARGPAGATGATGATGAKGDKGDTGATGASGTGGGLGNFRKFSASTFSPVALYNFQNDLTDSSGHGLTLTGASAIFRALGMQTDGTPIYGVAESVNADLKRASNDSVLTITGDITVQIIVAYTNLGTATTTAEWVAFEGGDETAANNYLWAIIQGSGSPKWFSEHGSGTDDTYSPIGTGNAVQYANPGGFVYWAFTRASNVIQGYHDGKPWGAASSALTAPTGGSTSTLRFFNKGTFGEFILCCKISASALSAANIASEYNSTLGLVKGLV